MPLHFVLYGDLGPDLIFAVYSVLGFIEDVMDEFVLEWRDGSCSELIVGDEEMLQSIDYEAHIAVAGLDYLHDPVADLLEEEMRLSEVYLLKADFALRDAVDQVTHT